MKRSLVVGFVGVEENLLGAKCCMFEAIFFSVLYKQPLPIHCSQFLSEKCYETKQNKSTRSSKKCASSQSASTILVRLESTRLFDDTGDSPGRRI